MSNGGDLNPTSLCNLELLVSVQCELTYAQMNKPGVKCCWFDLITSNLQE